MRLHLLRSPLALLSIVAITALSSTFVHADPIVVREAPRVVTPALVTEAQARAHVIRPPHVIAAKSDLGLEEARTIVNVPLAPKPPALDVHAFGVELNNKLKSSVTGYAMQIRQNGTVIETGIWNWAQTPADASKGWTFDTRMHIASVSKLMTGIALYKLLDAKHILPSATIAQYLPTYWSKGANVDKITFSDLMRHTSGFNTGGSASDFTTMKQFVAQGVTTSGPNAIGKYHYQNMNYGLCRILISVINGDIAVNEDAGPGFPSWAMGVRDAVWDLTTINAYVHYVQNHVFTPAGVTDASLASQAGDARAYSFYQDNGKGWDSGDLTSMAGGAAWHMTVNDVMKVMGTLRRGGKILPSDKAQGVLDGYFGIDASTQTAAGTLYTKNGLWNDGSHHTEQDVVFFLPQNVELVVFVNSPDGQTPAGETGPGIWLSGVVQSIYTNNLH
jgi:CubicO group peptidase (beta-lactamase class C family)